MTQAVDQRKRDDGLVFAEEGIRYEGAQKRGEIDRRGEAVHPDRGFPLVHQVGLASTVHEMFRHEDGEDRLHPVEAEPLGRLVPYDVGYAGRHAVGRCGRCAVLGHGLVESGESIVLPSSGQGFTSPVTGLWSAESAVFLNAWAKYLVTSYYP